jgi:predicted dehydrogenase
MVQAAREGNLLLMEAMWTRFLPASVRLRELLADGAIGEPRLFVADFGFRTRYDPAGMTLRHEHGQIASAALSFRVDTPREGTILGTDGWVRLHRPWWGASRLTIGSRGGAEGVLEFPAAGYGYQHEAEEFMTLIRAGRRDSSIMPLRESLTIMETMDALRSAWGVVYPGE